MNDQISRQKLREELENWYLVYNNRSWNEAIDKVKEIIESQPPADKWIPCSRELPKKSGKYLVTQKRYPLDDKLHKRPISIETDYVEFNVSDNKWNRASFFEVTAWQQPESYKGE